MKNGSQVVHANGLFNNSGYALKHSARDLGKKLTVHGEVVAIEQVEMRRTGDSALPCSRNHLESIVGASTVLSSW